MIRIIVLAGALASSVLAPAHAQGLAGDLARHGFGDGDYTAMRDAGAKLYEPGDPKVGASTPWSNPKTGAKGSVEITDVVTRDDGSLCVKLRNLAQTATMKEAQAFVGLRCRADDGAWKIGSP